MEAIAALSLACNVMQLVGQTLTVAKTIREIQQRGGSSDNEHLDDLNQKLHSGATKVEDCSRSINVTSSHDTSLNEINTIAQELQDISTQLQNELGKLRRRDQRISTLIKHTAKTLAKRGDIQKLEKRLKDQQEVLNSRLLIDLWQQTTRKIQDADISRFIESFRFPGLNERVNQIRSVDESSFNWIFDKDNASGNRHSSEDHNTTGNELDSDASLEFNGNQRELEVLRHQDVWESFQSWLRNNSNEIYWINGKAGSGKSTLMKKIWDHAEMTEMLKLPNDPRRSCILRYGFWLSGSPTQRSLKGLLSSLLYQLLSFCPGIAQGNLGNLQHMSNKRTIDDWNDTELQRQLANTLKVSIDVLKIGVFIDGLDEFDSKKDPRDLLKVLNILAQQAHTKVCVSSRPEPFWMAQFHQTPQLRLQDLNYSDIQNYIYEQLQDLSLPEDGNNEEQVIRNFSREVASRARGVFLWAHVVTRLLRRGSQSMTSWNDYWQRLLSMPEEMQALYEDMLNRLGSELNFTASEMALYLKACLLQTDKFLTTFAVHLYSKLQGDQKIQTELYTLQHLENASKRIRERIAIIGTGFLDIVKIDSGYAARNAGFLSCDTNDLSTPRGFPDDLCYSIEFSHRSVRDFVVDTNAGQKLIQNCSLSDEAILDAYLEDVILTYQLLARNMMYHYGYHLVKRIGSLCDEVSNYSENLKIGCNAFLTRLYAITKLFFTDQATLPTLSEYLKTIHQYSGHDCLPLLLACVPKRAFDEDRNNGKSIIYLTPGYDCLGTLADRGQFGVINDVWSLIASTPELSRHYTSYLLLCLSCSFCGPLTSLESQNWVEMVQAGGSLFMTFHFPWHDFRQVSTASTLLSLILNCTIPGVPRLLEFVQAQTSENAVDQHILLAFAASSKFNYFLIKEFVDFNEIFSPWRERKMFWLQVNITRHLINILSKESESKYSLIHNFFSAFGKFPGDRFVLLSEDDCGVIPSEEGVKEFMTSVVEQDLYHTGSTYSVRSPSLWDKAEMKIRSTSAESVNIYDFFRKLGYIKEPPDPAAQTKPIPPFDPMPETQEEYDDLIDRLSLRYQNIRASERYHSNPLALPIEKSWYPQKQNKAESVNETDEVVHTLEIRRKSTEFFDAAEKLS